MEIRNVGEEKLGEGELREGERGCWRRRACNLEKESLKRVSLEPWTMERESLRLEQ